MKWNAIELSSKINLKRTDYEGGRENYYKVTEMRQLDSCTFALSVTVEEVAIDRQRGMIELVDGEYEELIFYPMEETLKSVLESEDFTLLGKNFNPIVLTLEDKFILFEDINL